MKRRQWIGIGLCLAVAAYCWSRAVFANLHVSLAEQSDLKLFPKFGREISMSLHILMASVVILATSAVLLLARREKPDAYRGTGVEGQ